MIQNSISSNSVSIEPKMKKASKIIQDIKSETVETILVSK